MRTSLTIPTPTRLRGTVYPSAASDFHAICVVDVRHAMSPVPIHFGTPNGRSRGGIFSRSLIEPTTPRRPTMHDLLIRGGLIIDGSGNPGFYGAVAVEDERVRILRGDTAGIEARRVIDATSRVVCPGFIDMHAHSGLVILAEPQHEPKVRQGITTELIGIDGNSYAPFHSHDDFLKFVQINSGLDGNPRPPGRWSTVEQYLDMFTGRVAVNIAYVVGNSPLRIGAVGWDDRPATRDEMANQKALLRTAMEEGAWGMSTGLDYPPGSYAH